MDGTEGNVFLTSHLSSANSHSIVINPMLRQNGTYGGNIAIPSQNEASVVPRLLNQMIKPYGDLVNYPCISLPRLLYGSVEDRNESFEVDCQRNIGADVFA